MNSVFLFPTGEALSKHSKTECPHGVDLWAPFAALGKMRTETFVSYLPLIVTLTTQG